MSKKWNKDHLIPKPWVNVNDCRPPCYELVVVEFDDGKQQIAWWNINCWDFLVKKSSGTIVRWKKTQQHAIMNP